jgi:hypothetical protein
MLLTTRYSHDCKACWYAFAADGVSDLLMSSGRRPVCSLHRSLEEFGGTHKFKMCLERLFDVHG